MLVQSVNSDLTIEVDGFELAEPDRHMMAWIRRGPDFPAFVVNDVEAELSAQDVGARLLSLTLLSKPDIETGLRQLSTDPMHGVVTAMTLRFPVELRVVSGTGDAWVLGVDAVYRAANMDAPDRFSLQFDFNVISSRM